MIFPRLAFLDGPMAIPNTNIRKLQHEDFKRVLGIDPGLQVTGYSVLEKAGQGAKLIEAGIISTKDLGTKLLQLRISSLYDSLKEIIEQYKPQSMAVEQLFSHYKHPRTAILMAHARGVILLAAAQFGISVTSYNPTRVKKLLTGSGRAGKIQVQWAIQRELGLAALPEPADVADAMAIGLTHIHAISLEKPEFL